MGKAVANLEVRRSPLVAMAERLSIDATELQSVIMKTVMPAGGKDVTSEQFLSFVAVANAYGLDPLKREIFAFPAKGGGIQAIVSIDGWMSIINSQPEYDGMELIDNEDASGNLVSVTCKIFRKDRAHPTIITEHLSECRQGTDPWKQRPRRMLRHKASIQGSRYAFGLGGIMEEDEAREIEINPAYSRPGEQRAEPSPETVEVKPAYPVDLFTENLPKWRGLIESGRKTADDVIATVESKGALTDDQKKQIKECAPIEGEAEIIEQ